MAKRPRCVVRWHITLHRRIGRWRIGVLMSALRSLAHVFRIRYNTFSFRFQKFNMASTDTPAASTTNAQGGRTELIAEFDRLGIVHETLEHPEVFTVEAMMPHIQHLTGAFCKNLFVKDKKKRLYLLTALHDRPIQLNAVCKKVGASGGLRLADESILKEKLGVTQGSVTPFAIFNDKAGDVKFILDSDIVNGGHEKMFGHPMVNTASTAISPEDMMKFAREMGHEPVLLDFSDV